MRRFGKRQKTLDSRQVWGFTLIELLVVVAIMVVIAAGVVFNLGSFNQKQNLELALNSVGAVARDVQQRAVTQQDGKRWGMRFYNTDSDRYEVFSGINYASGTLDKIYSFRQGISFGEPAASSSIDVVFDPLTGKLANNKVISLITGRSDGLVGDLILNKTGLITSRLENGLVGYWHLDEGTSTSVYDAAGSGRKGTTAGPSWKTNSNCPAGSCLSFNSVENDSIAVSGKNPVIGTAPFTIAAWLKVGSHANYGLAFYVGGAATGQSAWIGWCNTAQVGSSNSIGGGFYGRNYGSGITDTTGWHYVTMTFSGGNSGAAKIYVDGIQKVTDSYTPNLAATAITFGKADSGTAYWYNGDIDEARLYNRALTATEILNIYNDLK